MVIAIAATKGGTGKTTTAAALAQAFADMGRTSLLVDADAQGSASLIYGAEESPGLYAALMGGAKASDLVQSTEAGDILPSSPELDGLDLELARDKGRDTLLARALEPLRASYDEIVIDTAPGVSTLLVQALTAADKVLIPVQADTQSLRGLEKLAETVADVQRYTNKRLEVAGVVVTMYDGRTVLAKQYGEMIGEACEQMGIPLASTHIRRAVAVQEAQAMRQSLYQYAPKSNPAVDYRALIEELNL